MSSFQIATIVTLALSVVQLFASYTPKVPSLTFAYCPMLPVHFAHSVWPSVRFEMLLPFQANKIRKVCILP